MVKHIKAAILGLIVVIADQLTKYSASRLSSPVSLGFFQLNLVRNTGAGFGILQNQRMLLSIASLLILAWIIWKWDSFEDRFSLPLGLLVGGLVGYLIDRLFLGYVIDFIDLGWWPVFNIADSCLTVSVLWIIALELKTYTHGQK